MLETSGPLIDHGYLQVWAARLGVTDELALAIQKAT
jgi:hypothetical protein